MAKRRLGQNFLFDPAILRRIVEAARLSPEDTVVEIGPGHGRLTRMLAGAAGRVIAIELDDALFRRLEGELGALPNVELVHEDALRYPYEKLGRFKVVANIPYYITTPIIFRLLENRDRLQTMTILMQREVAERIVAKPGGKDYGVLSVSVQYYGRPELKFIVPRGAFRPVPKVDSALLHVEVSAEPCISVADEEMFFRVVRTAFGQRRKTLENSLRPLAPDIGDKLRSLNIDPKRRPETMSIEEFAAVAAEIGKAMPGPGQGQA